jgi:hypothetical protein
MANQADVYVKNSFEDNININLIPKLPDGSTDPAVIIVAGNEEKIPLQGTDASLIINGPEGMDTNECSIKVASDVDLAVSHSRTHSNWTIKIVPNNLRNNTPTTVNVDVGEKGP